MNSAAAVALAGTLALGAIAACAGDDAAAPPSTAAVASGATPTPDPQSPFCEGVSAAMARLDSDPPDDVSAYLATTYEELLGVAPAEVVPAIESLIVGLSGSSPSGTVAATTPDGTVADDVTPSFIVVSPADVLTEYVDANCSRVAANPGPAATVPGDGFDVVPDTVATTTTVATG